LDGDVKTAWNQEAQAARKQKRQGTELVKMERKRFGLLRNGRLQMEKT